MTNEGKQLLLQDLCGRLPYGVMCYGVTKDMDEDGYYCDKEVIGILYELHSYKCCYGLVGLMNECDIESIKPYLRPMSSMTEEEFKEYKSTWVYLKHEPYTCVQSVESYDWLNAHHFDYRGLIKRGLALEAKEGMYGKEAEK